MGCPASTALTLGNIDCLINITEVDKLLIRRRGQADIALAALNLKAGVDALLAASDSTKLILTPFLYNSAIEPGGVITDDKKLMGISVVVGEEPSKMTAKLRLTSAIYAELKDMEDEIGLEAILINQDGSLFAKDGVASDTFTGIPFESMFTSATRVGGHGTADENDFELSFKSDWFENLEVIKADTLDYKALYDIENA